MKKETKKLKKIINELDELAEAIANRGSTVLWTDGVSRLGQEGEVEGLQFLVFHLNSCIWMQSPSAKKQITEKIEENYPPCFILTK